MFCIRSIVAKGLPALFLLVLATLLVVSCISGEAPVVHSTPDSANATSAPTPAKVSNPPSTPSLLVPSPTPQVHYVINPIWRVPPSIDEQILTSKVIVVASLQSVTAATETISSGAGVASTYRPLQQLKFKAHEYLKGTGPQEFVVEVRGEHTYLTKAEAKRVSDWAVSNRTNTWDKRQGMIFLQGPLTPAASGGKSGSSSTKSYEFTTSNPIVQSEWAYSVDTLSRAWLPATQAPAGGSGNADGVVINQEYITDGAKSPPPTITLAKLRTRISEIDAMLKAGKGAEYRSCIETKLTLERSLRAEPYTPPNSHATLDSGKAAGLEMTESRRNHPAFGEPKYHKPWVSGTDAVLFQSLIVDGDTNPGTGYDHTIVTARPLSAGTYRIDYSLQPYRLITCNFMILDPPGEHWTITVTAPTGTVHEAFFDPVAIGSAVGFDSSNGILKPDAFSVGETTISITGLRWDNGEVVLNLSPYVSLGGHKLDFIEMDGAISLSLAFNDAISDSEAGTFTWSVEKQPWESGDKLMIRIR